MEIRNQLKAANYLRKLVFGDTTNILPFDVRAQKPQLGAEKPQPLPRETPEASGVSAELLADFLEELAQHTDSGVHSVFVTRYGKVLCEAHFAPFSANYWHVTHSLCKTFTGTAIGLLIDEGLLQIDETICSIFPEKCSFLTSKRTRHLTIYHLLTMSSGVNFKEQNAVLNRDWVKDYLDAEVTFEPGTAYEYNSMNSYILSAVVRKKAGLGLVEYLIPRLFAPLGFGDVKWETCPLGNEKGGWGMYLFAEDMAKLGILYLQKGAWTMPDGTQRQILSPEWVEKATTAVGTLPNGQYGYQLWVEPDKGTFTFNGLFGQYVYVNPQNGIVISLTSGSENLFVDSATYSVLEKYFTGMHFESSAIKPVRKQTKRLAYAASHLVYRKPLAPMPTFWQALQARLFAKEVLPCPAAETFMQQVEGKLYSFKKNHIGMLPTIIAMMNDYYPQGITAVSFVREGTTARLLWEEGGEAHELPLSLTGGQPVSTLVAGGNEFYAATRAEFTQDEDDNPVLKLMVMLPESSNTRTVKFRLCPDGEMECLFDELPAVMRAATALAASSGADSVASTTLLSLKDINYADFLMKEFFTPHIKSVPQPQAVKELTEGDFF